MTSIEDLNKTQLILLTLLICFVTSISASIITTALLAEAPVGVTKTINRIVERTVEKAVPTDTTSKITISDEDKALLLALQGFSQSSVTVLKVDTDGVKNKHSLGVYLSGEGLVVARKGSLTATSTGEYIAELPNSNIAKLSLIQVGEDDDIAIFKVSTTTVSVEEN